MLLSSFLRIYKKTVCMALEVGLGSASWLGAAQRRCRRIQ